MSFGGRQVIVAARVVRVRARANGGWRVRLADTGGALLAAEIPVSASLPLPLPGERILLRGGIRYDPVHGWYTVDPVEEWYRFEAGTWRVKPLSRSRR
jgi:hypothetical protein